MPLSERIKILGKQAINSASNAHYHYYSRRNALQALAQVEKTTGKLDAVQKRLAYEYANEILGWKGYAPWLYVYTAVAGEFKHGWIPDNYYGSITIDKIQGDYGRISFLKPLNDKIFNASIGSDMAYFVNGYWFEKDFRPVSKKSFQEIISRVEAKVVFKTDQSYQGKGVYLHDTANLNIATLERHGNGILQKYIDQHQFFNEFVSGAVANIRMTTVVTDNGQISLRAAYLRLGRSQDTHVRSDSHIRIPVDIVTGSLYDYAYLANWERINQHPDSKTTFANKTIPSYTDCASLVLKLHESMPMVRCIGWDVIVDRRNRPVIMEWNGYGNDIKFSEAVQGPCFKDLNWNPIHFAPRGLKK